MRSPLSAMSAHLLHQESVSIIGVGCADLVHRTLQTCQLHHLENHLTHKLCVWGQKYVGVTFLHKKGEFLDTVVDF